jgi:hypothetical protein
VAATTSLAGVALVAAVVVALVAAARERERLRQSLIQQARAERAAGNRWRSLELLAEAARMRPGDELRSDAIQAITQTGCRCIGEFRLRGKYAVSPDGQWLASVGEERERPREAGEKDEPPYPILVRHFPSGQLLARRGGFGHLFAFRPGTAQLAIGKVKTGALGKEEWSDSIWLWDPVADKDLGPFAGLGPSSAGTAASSSRRVRVPSTSGTSPPGVSCNRPRGASSTASSPGPSSSSLTRIATGSGTVKPGGNGS